jgi:CRP/FNR family cyclic AMP-dependent transcriptional regulator
MAQYSDLVSLLRAVPLFAGLDPAKVKLLAFSSACLSLDDGEVLFYTGEAADAVYIIQEGEAEILVDAGRDEVHIGTLGRNWLLGELAAFRNQPRSATIRAVGRLRVLRIDADVFLRIVSENPQVALNVMRILSDKLARLTESVERYDGGHLRVVSDAGTC